MYVVAERRGHLVPFNDSADYETTRTRLLQRARPSLAEPDRLGGKNGLDN